MRKIIHIDMDAFYASVEQRDCPAYRGKPVAVGGKPEHRGVVATASYEARGYGIRSAMSSRSALRLCPELILLSPRFEVYQIVSRQIRAVFAEYTDKIEPLSLDEAYLDVTENYPGIPSATIIAREIKARIQAETGLTASAGVSFNKFLAKAASDFRKPDGLHVIPPQQAEAFAAALPIEQFYGIGAKTAPRLKAMGIQTGRDLKALPMEILDELFGRSASFYYGLARGLDDRPVETDGVRKSVGAEKTFAQDIRDPTVMRAELALLADDLLAWMKEHRTYGRTLTVKVKYADFQQITRSRTVQNPLRDKVSLLSLAEALLQSTEARTRPVRLLGLSVSKLESQDDSVAEAFDHIQPVQLCLPLTMSALGLSQAGITGSARARDHESRQNPLGLSG